MTGWEEENAAVDECATETCQDCIQVVGLDEMLRSLLGRKVLFTMTDGSIIEGEVRNMNVPQGDGGENLDGKHTVRVSGTVEHFLDPTEILEAWPFSQP